MHNTWVFGYGSLIWSPGFIYVERQAATLHGWARKFWQGSHDHRGTPEAPGRVVTLIPEVSASCAGMMYLIEPAVVEATFENLDHREKNGYTRVQSQFRLANGNEVQGVVYIADEKNSAYLGDAPLHTMALQIIASVGPSGRNIDYLFDLAEALRQLNAQDTHVFALEQCARKILA